MVEFISATILSNQNSIYPVPYAFFKGHLLVKQFVDKAGCTQLFLVPTVKNIQFLLLS
jgi:hypothetical protein